MAKVMTHTLNVCRFLFFTNDLRLHVKWTCNSVFIMTCSQREVDFLFGHHRTRRDSDTTESSELWLFWIKYRLIGCKPLPLAHIDFHSLSDPCANVQMSPCSFFFTLQLPQCPPSVLYIVPQWSTVLEWKSKRKWKRQRCGGRDRWGSRDEVETRQSRKRSQRGRCNYLSGVRVCVTEKEAH